jgi:hypothetical protein
MDKNSASRQSDIPNSWLEHLTKPSLYNLSLDLRLLFWEATWPEPPSFEPAYTHAYQGCYTQMSLQISTTLSTALQHHHDSRLKPYQTDHWPASIALYICQESRNHTLTKYNLLKPIYPPSTKNLIYMSPSRDLFFPSFTYLNYRSRDRSPSKLNSMRRQVAFIVSRQVNAVRRSYREKLGCIQTLLVDYED